MTKRIFSSTIIVVVSALLLSIVLITGVLYSHFETVRLEELERETTFVSQGVEQNGLDYLCDVEDTNCRITWIDADGTVLYDNESDVATMENHLDREEVKEALENQSGISVRQSQTLSENTIYYAVRLTDGTVLRLATAQSSVLVLLGGMLTPFFFILLIACVFAGLLSYRVSKKIVRPLSEVDLKHPEQAETYEELAPFLQRIAAQNREISRKMEEIQEEQQKFSMITDNMSEGMFIIDRDYRILSYNKSAMRIFSMHGDKTYDNLLSVNRSESFRSVVDQALQGRHAQKNLSLDGRVYQVIANASYQADAAQELAGAVLLVLDVTEKEEQEQYRREFTANVSHELKTPLTSISGMAEIMRDGIVQPKDISHFSGKIYEESQRLITLIGDIIKLSQLDENQMPMEREQVDLLDTARDVVARLAQVAKQNGVTVVTNGTHGVVYGVRQVLTEMLYNLCENAVKYNHTGGRVWMEIVQTPDTVVVTVSDTGIGIPIAHQARVFERFYRVDKSHSKAVGGTGLGLSIVKHGAALHHAEISMESQEGKGTKVTLIFPKRPD